MDFFEVNKAKGTVVFKNTGKLANQVNEIISALRKMANTVSPELGKYVKKKTPGPFVVKIAVWLVFRNNAFNFYRREFQYHGKVGIITRPVNWKINRVLRTSLPQPTELAEASITILATSLLRKSKLPGFAVESTASAMAYAVIVALKESGDASSISTDDVKQAAAFANQSAFSALDIAKELQRNPPDVQKYFYVDQEKSHIRFENTDDLANNINKLIAELRDASGTVPHVGEDLSAYMKKKTPGPITVRLGVKHVLKNNAFSYKTMQFESLGSSIGTTNLINKKINKKLNKQYDAAIIKMEALVLSTCVKELSQSYLSRLPDGILKDKIIYQLSEMILEFTVISEPS